MRIVAHVHNGVIQTIWTEVQNADVVIVSTDDDFSDEEETAAFERLNAITVGLNAVY